MKANPIAHPEGADKPRFRVLIIYENKELGRCAMGVYERLELGIEREFRFEVNLWNFAMLAVSPLRETARDEAIDADLIVIATEAERTLPVAVEQWIEGWLPEKREQDAALVALIPVRAKPAFAGVDMYLAAAAQRGQMKFLVHFVAPLAEKGALSSSLPPPRSSQLAHPNPGLADERNTWSHGGINE